jgi:outer membrane lipoprotein-sorting protein
MHMVSLLALALTAPFVAQDDDALLACRALEKRINEAKSLRITVGMTIELENQRGERKRGELSGSVWLAEGNKARIDLSGKAPGDKDMQFKMISDGHRMLARVKGQPDRPPHEAPKDIGEIIRGTISRAGIFAGVFYGVPEKEEPKLDDLYQISDFKLGARQKSGSREILIIDYKIGFRGAKEKGLITLALYADSMLPQKRIFTITDAAHKVRIIETYSEFTVDPMLEAKQFDLPE